MKTSGTNRYLYADNGDIIAHCYAAALELMNESHLSLGVCKQRCSILKDLSPLAFGWVGKATASSMACPICGAPLHRTTGHCWAGSIQMLGIRDTSLTED